MADETETTAPKRRRVARPADATDDPRDKITEDRTRIGWPGVSSSPFVPQSYYETFPAEFRPQFETSGAGDNLSADQLRQMESGWKDPIEHITIVNVSDKDQSISILGMSPGEVLHVKVPAHGGVVRGPVQGYLHTGHAGSKYSSFLKIGPSYEALAEPTTDSDEREHRAKAVLEFCEDAKTKPLINGERLAACMLYGCSVKGHSKVNAQTGELETTLSLRHAQYLVEAIGQPLTTPNAQTGEDEILYTPELDYAKKQIKAFIPMDNRPDSFIFATNRIHVLERREEEIKDRLAQGKFSAGR